MKNRQLELRNNLFAKRQDLIIQKNTIDKELNYINCLLGLNDDQLVIDKELCTKYYANSKQNKPKIYKHF